MAFPLGGGHLPSAQGRCRPQVAEMTVAAPNRVSGYLRS
jgi:hypothetical protein